MHRTPHSRQLSRSQNGYIAGVCEGLGRHFDINPTILRLAWLGAILFFGTGVLVYLAMWWIIPHEDALPIEPAVWRKLPNGRHEAPLQRTTNDRKFLGVCGGLARHWNIDPSLLRLGVLSLAMLSFGLVAVIYLLAALFIPGSYRPVKPYAHPVEL